MPVVHSRSVEITLPQAEYLADLYGVADDLEIAERTCKTALMLDGTHGFDTEIMNAVVSAAVVRYWRCFKKSRARRHLDRSALSDLSEGDLAFHDRLEALRDKFIAHSENAFEETYVTASAREVDGVKLPIATIHPGSNRVVLSSFEARPLVGLISKVRPIVDRLISAEEKKLLEFLQSLPLEEVHSGDLHRPRQLLWDDVFKNRRQESKTPK